MLTKRLINAFVNEYSRQINNSVSRVKSEQKIKISIETDRDNVRLYGSLHDKRTHLITISREGYLFRPGEDVVLGSKRNSKRLCLVGKIPTPQGLGEVKIPEQPAYLSRKILLAGCSKII